MKYIKQFPEKTPNLLELCQKLPLNIILKIALRIVQVESKPHFDKLKQYISKEIDYNIDSCEAATLDAFHCFKHKKHAADYLTYAIWYFAYPRNGLKALYSPELAKEVKSTPSEKYNTFVEIIFAYLYCKDEAKLTILPAMQGELSFDDIYGILVELHDKYGIDPYLPRMFLGNSVEEMANIINNSCFKYLLIDWLRIVYKIEESCSSIL